VYDFKYDGGGLGKGGDGIITVDGNKAAGGRVEKTQPGIFSVDDLADVGTDDGTWVADYGASAHFNGHLQKVTIQVHPAALSESDKAKVSEMQRSKRAAE
jgi:arylsulfatase